jgi:hypothetical protein
MATANDVREWGRAAGHDIGVKGRVPAWLVEGWNDDHPGDPFTPPAASNGHGSAPDYPEGMTEDDFPTAGAEPPDDDGATGETKPRRTRKPAAASRAAGWRDRLKGRSKTGTGKKKPKHPRIPVDDLICSAWRVMARIARPMPPVHRVLRIQAPVAGALLEDVVRDTLVDRFMQPLARLQTGGKTAVALAGPPMIVAAITIHCAQAAQQGRAPSRLFMETAQEMLREALLIWMDVAGPKFEAAMAREKEFEEKYGKTVDETIAWLFSAPVIDADEEAVKAEEDAVRRAQGILADE